MTARDWARFGQLFWQNGKWNGEQLLPDWWVKYATTPTPFAELGNYGKLFLFLGKFRAEPDLVPRLCTHTGAQWWLNAGNKDDPSRRHFPRLPTDAFMALGYESQSVIVIPSRAAVIVRLGCSHPEAAFDVQEWVTQVLAALPPAPAKAAAAPAS